MSYINPLRVDIISTCPFCLGEIVPKGGQDDPLMQIYRCVNSNCKAGRKMQDIHPDVPIYKCTVCETETTEFAEDGLPYCSKHLLDIDA